jgi:polyferredoxin
MMLPGWLRSGLALVLAVTVCVLAGSAPAFAGGAPAVAAAGAGAAAGWHFEEAGDAEPGLAQLAKDQAPDIVLFAAFAALAMASFLRKSIALKYATLVACVLYMGFYKSQLISVVNVFGLLVGNLPIFAHSMAWHAFAIFTAVTTVLWGRLYCGRVCAYGAFTQLMDAVLPKRLRIDIPPAIERRAGYIKYVILLGAIGAFLATGEISFYRYIEPFWMFTLQASTVLWIALGVLLLATVFVRNLYCRFLCPLGAFLGLVASVTTVFRIKRWSECSSCKLCEQTCEWGAIRKRMIIRSECVRCDDCEILYDNKAECPHWLRIARRARLKARQWVARAGSGAA